MRAVTWHGRGDIRVSDVPEPRISEPTDAVVRVTSTAICGSDLHLYGPLAPFMTPGDIMGHEFMGVVEEVGSGVTRLRPGDRVVVPFNIACGMCFFCARGLLSNCHNVNANATAVGGIYGYSHTAGGYDGGQAEMVRVPFADVGPRVIPEWLHDEDALLLTLGDARAAPDARRPPSAPAWSAPR